jgi:predicted O-methyltransferase YrrM
MKIGNYLRGQLDRYLGQFAHRSDIDNLRRQIACLVELQAAILAPIPYGKLGGWAISADALAVVVRDIRARQAPRVVEFGSGVSTIAIAALLRTMGEGTLITIEHNMNYLKSVESNLATSGLKDYVELHHLPIVDFPAAPPMTACRSYDLRQLDVRFDVALIDGPITSEFGAATRMAPLAWCIDRLCFGASIYLDDADRAQERLVVATLRAIHPDVQTERLEAEKGLVRLTRSAETAA